MDLFELRRQIFHILVGIAIILGVLFIPYAKIIGLIVLIFGGLMSFMTGKFHIPIISNSLNLFERQCNVRVPGRGVLFFFVGSLLVLQLFSLDIALASIMILTFADPISHFIGQHFGKTILLNKRKYLEGSFWGVLIGGGFASFFIHPLLAFSGAFIAMFLESVELAMAGETIDDNLLIPLVAGTVMYFIGGWVGLI
tara:strand:+ start:4450 stop:5040 length:591 start_codon:yes stop_codon:yes gene_type:complete